MLCSSLQGTKRASNPASVKIPRREDNVFAQVCFIVCSSSGGGGSLIYLFFLRLKDTSIHTFIGRERGKKKREREIELNRRIGNTLKVSWINGCEGFSNVEKKIIIFLK